MVAQGKRLEELERPRAEERQAATQAQPGEGKVGGGNFPPPANLGKTRDKVGAAVGVSGKTYEKAAAVVQAAEEDPENPKRAGLPGTLADRAFAQGEEAPETPAGGYRRPQAATKAPG